MSLKITPCELCKLDFDLTDIFAMRQIWTKGALFSMNHPRKSNGIIFLSGAVGIYTVKNGDKLDASQNSIVFLPEKSEYTVLNAECGLGDTDAYLIEFNMKADGEDIIISDKPFLLSECAKIKVTEIIEKIVRLYEASVRSYPLIKGMIFELISLLIEEKNTESADKYASIRKGIAMLESNVYGDISISEVAKACNVSEAHFRRLFKEYAQKSPIRYRIELKISYAKRMLTDTDMSVERISEALGFESTSFFCRVFKRKTGVTPSEYRNA